MAERCITSNDAFVLFSLGEPQRYKNLLSTLAATDQSHKKLPVNNPPTGLLTDKDGTAKPGQSDSFLARMRELEDFKFALDEHAILAVTDARGAITYVNDKFCAISKWSREELLGHDHRIINSGHHSKEFIREMWATIRSGIVWKG